MGTASAVPKLLCMDGFDVDSVLTIDKPASWPRNEGNGLPTVVPAPDFSPGERVFKPA
jgi:hypothetical protein